MGNTLVSSLLAVETQNCVLDVYFHCIYPILNVESCVLKSHTFIHESVELITADN